MKRKHYLTLLKWFIPVWIMVPISAGCSGMSYATGSQPIFLQDGSIHNGGKWSPDGRWFATSTVATNALQILSPQGKVASTISSCDLPGDGRNYAWLPDGRISCFLSNEPPTLQIIKLDQHGHPEEQNTVPVPILPGTGVYDIGWNPHHFWLATIVEAQPGTGASSLLLSLSDLQGHSLITSFPITAQQLSWSPDGTTLAIGQQNGAIALWGVQQGAGDRLSLKLLRELLAGNPVDENVAWSPTGRWLVSRHRSAESEDYLFLLAADGSGKQVKLTSSTTYGQLAYPAWSPDGKQLIVMRVVDGVLLSLDMTTLLKEKGVAT
jgi:Tol biopolymer transport system component